MPSALAANSRLHFRPRPCGTAHHDRINAEKASTGHHDLPSVRSCEALSSITPSSKSPAVRVRT